MSSLVYKTGVSTGSGGLFLVLDALLSNPFNATDSGLGRGLGWQVAYEYASDDKLYSSVGSGGSERINLKLAVDGDYINRSICQYSEGADVVNEVGAGGDSTATRIDVGAAEIQYWVVGNQDFFHIVILKDSTYSHYYSGILNRFAPSQNSSIYGLGKLDNQATITPDIPFEIGIGTLLGLRIGFDGYGGSSASTNNSFFIGQKLTIVDQSISPSPTSGNHGVVVLNSIDEVDNTITVTWLAGDTTFSSFAIIGVDPQPVLLNSGGTIFGNQLFMLDDYDGGAVLPFYAVDEFTECVGMPPLSIQNPDSRGVYLTYPIRISNDDELRGTFYGLIETPVGSPGPQDLFETFDRAYRFVNFIDGTSYTIAIGSII